MEQELIRREARVQQEISHEPVRADSPRIFINYRRDDAAGDAGRLYDALSAHFGEGSVFMDVDTIPPGADFAELINQSIGSCEVLVAVIGKSWLNLADASGGRRLDDQQDLVRMEILSALERKLRVVPVLVQGAQMPRADQLPASLAKLAGRHAFEISYTRWQYDVERLITAIDRSAGVTMRTRLPGGTLTFLMTDVQGSTKVWEASPLKAEKALQRHNRIITEQVEANHGQIVELGREGDSVLAVFKQASDAVACALYAQRLLQREVWPVGVDLRVRFAVHTGEAEFQSGHYVGAPLYRCARLMATGHGGQILMSNATQQLVADQLPDGVSLRDLGLHHLRDLSRAEHVFQLIHPDLTNEYPPLRSLEPLRTNLPQQLTSFVGRESELRTLKRLLRDSRLVTLVGTGGAGKSRLAAEVAKTIPELWPDGVWWVDLASANDAALAVVAALELAGSGSAQEVVTSWLAAKRALLILDNCEHLVAICAGLCKALLERCPELTILATSRESLGVPGEVRWPVSSLRDRDALHLFEVRAGLVSPDYKLSAPNLEAVSEICRRLDHLPLAIEMAAARLDLMSEPELLANLTDRFGFLASGSRTVPERQQTMTATIDWSYRLLTDEEARLFRRLSVFQGGFTLEAAQAVFEGGGRVLSVLGGLVQKSMVVAERTDAGSRYRFLESQHAYAIDKLRQAGELEATSRRHYEFFRSWLQRPLQPKEKARESANLWAALAWARENAGDMGLDFAIEVADFEHGDHARIRSVLLDLIERTQDQGAARARALNLAARLSSRQADHVESRALAESSVAAARRLQDSVLLAQMLSGAGAVYNGANELEAARKAYDEALSLLEGSSHRQLVVDVQNQIAILATEQGHYEEAVSILNECLAFSRSAAADASTAKYLESLANAELGLGHVDSAARSWHDGLLTFRDLDDPFGEIWCIGGLALIAAARGDDDRALRLAAVVDRMSREWSLSAWPLRISQLEQACKKARMALGTRKADDAWNDGLSMSADQALEDALGGAGDETAMDGGPLSRREREVAGMVAAGLTNKQIAAHLFIAERTAQGHVERIRKKLGVRSRTEVATWAVTHGIARDKA